MTELKNEFPWPKSKNEILKTCPRQYWFPYYDYWNGWLQLKKRGGYRENIGIDWKSPKRGKHGHIG